ncbi:MAG: adenosylmethionine--8-amino-7-oxononanoate transaminase [Proteobacteria bacterium]|nr:adenosylmethionine--8-amino-7-oxononanoate transaminase [Pseudomonadota bacterium]
MTRPTRERIVAIDKARIWHPYTPMRPYIEEIDPVVVDRAEGMYLYDADGARLIDGNASWWVNIVGHNHPRLVAALERQARRLVHCSLAGMVHEPAALLAEKLVPKCGASFSRLFFSDDGSTAVEAAIRMAYQFWRNLGRPEKRRFVTLEGAFHGETIGAASVSGGRVFHEALEGLVFDRILLPSPAADGGDPGSAAWHDAAFAEVERLLAKSAGEIAAIIVEPLVQGAAGMLMYPAPYLAKLAKAARERDILLICDEVFVGYGRTGAFLAEHLAGVEADIVCVAKGFSGGALPIAATIANERVFEAFRGGPEVTLWYGHSFTGNPLGCAVALETLAIIEEERLLERQPPIAAALQRGLEAVSHHPWVRDPRRTGLIAAFTLAAPGGAPARKTDYLALPGWRLYAEARKRGALLRPLGNVVYTVLPLNAEIAVVEELFGIVGESLLAAFGS